MNKTVIAALMLALSAPALAQDEPAEEPAADPAESAPAGEAPAEEAPAEGEAAVEEVTGEEAPAEEVAGNDEGADAEATPWALYLGVDYVNTTLSLSVPPTNPADEFDSAMYRIRVGARVLEFVGLELHYGVDNADEDAGEVPTDAYYGAYLVPTATVFEALELAFPVGYGRSEFGDGGASESFGSIAYGLNAELPVRALWDALPDLRLIAGYMVYYQKSDARVYGANFGLRYDFNLTL